MGYTKTIRRLLFVVPLIAVESAGWAQVDALTVRESEQILETLPVFKTAERRGVCPGFVPGSSEAPNALWLQMRGFCPPDEFPGSTTIETFQVDQFTGAVTEWPSGRSVAGTAETATLRRALVTQARARALSEHEAECVAREAASGSLIPHGVAPVIEKKGREGTDILFLVRPARPDRDANNERHVSVDARSLTIFAEGQRVESPGADALLDRMRTVRQTPSISLPEAIELARRAPVIRARIEKTCSAIVAAEYGTAKKTFVTVEDGCRPLPRGSATIGIVDTLTGAITEPGTNKPLGTAETARLAGQFLAEARQRRAVAEREIEKACPAR